MQAAPPGAAPYSRVCHLPAPADRSVVPLPWLFPLSRQLPGPPSLRLCVPVITPVSHVSGANVGGLDRKEAGSLQCSAPTPSACSVTGPLRQIGMSLPTWRCPPLITASVPSLSVHLCPSLSQLPQYMVSLARMPGCASAEMHEIDREHAISWPSP